MSVIFDIDIHCIFIFAVLQSFLLSLRILGLDRYLLPVRITMLEESTRGCLQLQVDPGEVSLVVTYSNRIVGCFPLLYCTELLTNYLIL